MQLNGALFLPKTYATASSTGFSGQFCDIFCAVGLQASVWITQEAHLDDRIRSLYSEQFVFRSVTHTEAKTTETKMTQLRDSKRSSL